MVKEVPHAMLVLILRSAQAQQVPQTRPSLRASRRMRTGYALMLRDASQRVSAVEAAASRCDAPQHEGVGSKHQIFVLQPEHHAAPAAADIFVLVGDVLTASHEVGK